MFGGLFLIMLAWGSIGIGQSVMGKVARMGRPDHNRGNDGLCSS